MMPAALMISGAPAGALDDDAHTAFGREFLPPTLSGRPVRVISRRHAGFDSPRGSRTGQVRCWPRREMVGGYRRQR